MHFLFAPWFDVQQRKTIIWSAVFLVIASHMTGFLGIHVAWLLTAGDSIPTNLGISACVALLMVALFCYAAGTTLASAIAIGLCGVVSFGMSVMAGLFYNQALLGPACLLIGFWIPLAAITWVLGHHKTVPR